MTNRAALHSRRITATKLNYRYEWECALIPVV